VGVLVVSKTAKAVPVVAIDEVDHFPRLAKQRPTVSAADYRVGITYRKNEGQMG
jgi:hypothetical protein